jgi:hypothetical protein
LKYFQGKKDTGGISHGMGFQKKIKALNNVKKTHHNEKLKQKLL